MNNRNNWNFSFINKSITKDKDRLIRSYINYMLIRTQKIFEYKNLPKTIPQKDLELILQLCGSATITKVDGELYAFYGGLGGMLNEYYQPTLSVVANPYLKYNKVLEIDEDCVVILNDSLYVGLTPLFDRYSEMLAETMISLRYAVVNSRIPMIAVANNDNTADSVNTLFEQVEKGESIRSILSKNPLDDKTFETRDYFSKNQGNIKDLIELYQYLLSSWYNELGIQSNYNMKRESLNSDEVGMNDDVLIPLIDEMLRMREIGVAKINEKYGTNISVSLSSVWKKMREEKEVNEDEI